jgi:hypothetical protein
MDWAKLMAGNPVTKQPVTASAENNRRITTPLITMGTLNIARRQFAIDVLIYRLSQQFDRQSDRRWLTSIIFWVILTTDL